MLKLVLLIVLFLLSLLTLLRAPTNWLWYISILVTEFSWIFFCVVIMLILVRFGGKNYPATSFIIGIAALVLYAIPFIDTLRMESRLKQMFTNNNPAANENTAAPFQWEKIITGLFAKQVAYQTMTYDTTRKLTLDFYPSLVAGKRPCVLVVHGGSWAGGDSRQLPELNSELAKQGYHVASINYRLAPQFQYPAPVEDVKTALTFLRENGDHLFINTNQFVLLGRSAGGQIVLSAAYTLHDTSLKGVIDFYGPADMVWGYAYPTNPLVLDSRKVMSDYLGGTYQQVPQQYVASSANYTATVNAVPTLLIYGKNDPLVSPLHGVRLGKKLDSLDAIHYDVYLPWATHAFDYTLTGAGGQLSTWCVLRFLEKVVVEKKD